MDRPVHLETVLEESRTVISFDGSEHQIEKGEPIEEAEGAKYEPAQKFDEELNNIGDGGSHTIAVEDLPRN